MKPKEAGFDGEKGVNLNIPHMKGGGVYCLRRGKKPPIENLKRPFNNQLCWYYPDGQDPKLLYCNDGGEWFDLSFEPVNVEEL
jgi:hypothetical protein